MVPPKPIPRVPKTLLTRLMVLVAETRPALFACRKPDPVPRVRAEVEALVKVLLPVKELLLVRSVVEEMVMLVVPSKVTPLMVRPVWSDVAVFALPPIESDAAEPVSPVPRPVNEEPVMTPVEVKFPTTVEEELAMYPLVNVWRDAQVLASERRDDGVARQVPLTEKQPEVRFTPVAKVDVAAVSVVVASPLEMERSVVEAPPLNDCSAVHALALLRLSVSDVEPPREMAPPPESPEPAETVSDEFWSWLLPMVEVETNLVPSYERSVPVVYEVALEPPKPMPRVPKTLLTRLMVLVAETRPALFACRKPEPVARVRAEVEAFVNVLLPVKVLLLARSVVEEMVMFRVPSKVTPLMVRPV